MAIYTVFSTNVSYSYKNFLWSKAAAFIFVSSGVTLLFPLIIAYRSRGFWLKHDTFIEQPDIKYEYNYVFVAVTTNPNFPIICSTYPEHKKHAEMFNRCNFIEVEENDFIIDGIKDELKFRMEVSVQLLEIKSFTLLLPLDYKLQTVCPLRMQTLGVIQKEFREATEEFKLVGDIGVLQKSSLKCILHTIDNQYNYSTIIPLHSDEEDDQDVLISMTNILTEYSRRKIQTTIQNQFTFTTAGRLPIFSIDITLNYPEHQIRYSPGFWQLIKWAWIQYLPIYIIFAWFMRKFQKYVFEMNLVESFKIIPWESKNNYYY